LNKIVVDGNGNGNANANANAESCVNELFDVIITHDLNIKKFVKKDKINEYESRGWKLYSIHFKKINI